MFKKRFRIITVYSKYCSVLSMRQFQYNMLMRSEKLICAFHIAFCTHMLNIHFLQRFRFCGDLDCPDWVLAEMSILSKIVSSF